MLPTITLTLMVKKRDGLNAWSGKTTTISAMMVLSHQQKNVPQLDSLRQRRELLPRHAFATARDMTIASPALSNTSPSQLRVELLALGRQQIKDVLRRPRPPPKRSRGRAMSQHPRRRCSGTT
jgi:hypothetical protein